MRPAERERDVVDLEQPFAHQMISTRLSPSKPFGRTIIKHDQQEPEDDVSGRAGVRDHQVLPDESGEVERGWHRDDAQPAPELRDAQHPDQQRQYATWPTQGVELDRDDDPVPEITPAKPPCAPSTHE